MGVTPGTAPDATRGVTPERDDAATAGSERFGDLAPWQVFADVVLAGAELRFRLDRGEPPRDFAGVVVAVLIIALNLLLIWLTLTGQA